jgi:hypothetical protein
VLAVLEAVGAIADPVRGEDKFAAIAAAVVVVVTPVLAQHTQPTEKRSTCSEGPRQDRHKKQSKTHTQ